MPASARPSMSRSGPGARPSGALSAAAGSTGRPASWARASRKPAAWAWGPEAVGGVGGGGPFAGVEGGQEHRPAVVQLAGDVDRLGRPAGGPVQRGQDGGRPVPRGRITVGPLGPPPLEGVGPPAAQPLLGGVVGRPGVRHLDGGLLQQRVERGHVPLGDQPRHGRAVAGFDHRPHLPSQGRVGLQQDQPHDHVDRHRLDLGQLGQRDPADPRVVGGQVPLGQRQRRQRLAPQREQADPAEGADGTGGHVGPGVGAGGRQGGDGPAADVGQVVLGGGAVDRVGRGQLVDGAGHVGRGGSDGGQQGDGRPRSRRTVEPGRGGHGSGSYHDRVGWGV